MDDCGALRDCRYLLHDRDTKFTQSFDPSWRQAGSNRSYCLRAPKPKCLCGTLGQVGQEECLSKVILFGERSLPRALSNLSTIWRRAESPGKGNVLLFHGNGSAARGPVGATSDCASRHYHREAAMPVSLPFLTYVESDAA